MIEGINLRLNPPKCRYADDGLKGNLEVSELLDDLTEYYSQSNIIYDAELVLSNNEYQRMQGDFGPYFKRIDFMVELRFVTEIIVYSDSITFKTADGECNVPVKDNFFYFMEWEDSYYL